MCAFYLFWLSASHGLRLGMDGMLLALCDHGFERSGLCAVNNNNLGYIKIGFDNLGTSNPIVLLYGVVFDQIRRAQIPHLFFALDSVVFGTQIR